MRANSAMAPMCPSCDGAHCWGGVSSRTIRGRAVSLALAVVLAALGGVGTGLGSAVASSGSGLAAQRGGADVAPAGFGLAESSSAQDAAAGVGPAPEWPFRGIVAHRVLNGANVLEYWDSSTGEVNRVRLGPVDEVDGCLWPIGASAESVRLEARGTFHFVRYGVPWGDEAYPLFVGLENGSASSGVLGADLEGRLEVSSVRGLAHVVTPGREAYYLPAGNILEGVGLELSAAPTDALSSTDALSEEELWERQWEAELGLIGSDGFYYGIGAVAQEPRCAGSKGFVVAGDTGEVVACTSGYGAPLRGAAFVLPEGSKDVLGEFALPQPVAVGECEPFELEALGALGVLGGPAG